MHQCIINGELRERGSAIAVTDRSFMLGDGLIETILVKNGKAVWLLEHFSRIKGSAEFFGIAFPYHFDEIARWSETLLKAENVSEGFLRLHLSRGASASGRFADIPDASRAVLIAGNAERVASPVTAAFAPWPINENDPTVRHKTASRIMHVHARRAAYTRGVDELVFCNTRGVIAEGIVSNIFWVKGPELFTPSEECGILPGIAREKVLSAAKKLGLKVRMGAFSAADLDGAGEMFFTNSLSVVRGCARFEKIFFGDPCTARALEQFVLSDS